MRTPAMKQKPTVWTLEAALEVIRAIQPLVREFGYHVALGGGVLNKGESRKDLDLYFLSLDNPKTPADASRLTRWLDATWGKGTPIGDDDYDTDKDVVYAEKNTYTSQGRRIDVFVIGGE